MAKLISYVNECLYGKEKTTTMLTSNTLIPFCTLIATINYTATVMRENRIESEKITDVDVRSVEYAIFSYR